MKNLYKIFFLSLIILSVSCKVDFDKLERKDGKFHYKGKPYTGYFYQNYKSGNILSEGEYKKGEIVGNYIKYYENGQIKEDLNYVGREHELNPFYYRSQPLDGVQKTYYDNGQLESIENYVMGTREGLFEKFDKYGNKLESFLYSEGERHGEFMDKEADNYGIIKIVGKYKMGKLDGELIRYKQNKIQKKIIYDNGKIKFEEKYDNNGKVIK
jgi:antitoxin component YwqK of YwqJK toxin-antitoxin module